MNELTILGFGLNTMSKEAAKQAFVVSDSSAPAAGAGSGASSAATSASPTMTVNVQTAAATTPSAAPAPASASTLTAVVPLKSKSIPGGHATSQFKIFNSLSSLKESLSGSLTAAVGESFNASLKISKVKQESINDIYCLLRLQSSTETVSINDEYKLGDSAEELLKTGDLQRFVEIYGDGFVDSVTYGCDAMLLIQFHLQSTEEQKSVSASLQAVKAKTTIGATAEAELTKSLKDKRCSIYQTVDGLDFVPVSIPADETGIGTLVSQFKMTGQTAKPVPISSTFQPYIRAAKSEVAKAKAAELERLANGARALHAMVMRCQDAIIKDLSALYAADGWPKDNWYLAEKVDKREELVLQLRAIGVVLARLAKDIAENYLQENALENYAEQVSVFSRRIKKIGASFPSTSDLPIVRVPSSQIKDMFHTHGEYEFNINPPDTGMELVFRIKTAEMQEWYAVSALLRAAKKAVKLSHQVAEATRGCATGSHPGRAQAKLALSLKMAEMRADQAVEALKFLKQVGVDQVAGVAGISAKWKVKSDDPALLGDVRSICNAVKAAEKAVLIAQKLAEFSLLTPRMRSGQDIFTKFQAITTDMHLLLAVLGAPAPAVILFPTDAIQVAARDFMIQGAFPVQFDLTRLDADLTAVETAANTIVVGPLPAVDGGVAQADLRQIKTALKAAVVVLIPNNQIFQNLLALAVPAAVPAFSPAELSALTMAHTVSANPGAYESSVIEQSLDAAYNALATTRQATTDGQALLTAVRAIKAAAFAQRIPVMALLDRLVRFLIPYRALNDARQAITLAPTAQQFSTSMIEAAFDAAQTAVNNFASTRTKMDTLVTRVRTEQDLAVAAIPADGARDIVIGRITDVQKQAALRAITAQAVILSAKTAIDNMVSELATIQAQQAAAAVAVPADVAIVGTAVTSIDLAQTAVAMAANEQKRAVAEIVNALADGILTEAETYLALTLPPAAGSAMAAVSAGELAKQNLFPAGEPAADNSLVVRLKQHKYYHQRYDYGRYDPRRSKYEDKVETLTIEGSGEDGVISNNSKLAVGDTLSNVYLKPSKGPRLFGGAPATYTGLYHFGVFASCNITRPKADLPDESEVVRVTLR